MELVNIFEKTEYKMLFILFAFNILTIYIFSNYLINDIGIKIYLIGFNYFSLYTIYCIFIESSFDSKYLQLLQIKLGSFISIISFLGLTSVALIYFFYQFIIYYCSLYHSECPFLLSKFDYKIHALKRCELYNINSTNIFPYQYICSFNAESSDRSYRLINSSYEVLLGRTFVDKMLNCPKVKQIIKNNEIIDAFLDEYYKETNLYYCDLKEQPWKFKEVDPKICDEEIDDNYLVFLLINYYFSIRCFFSIFYYLRHIKPNINNNDEHSHLL